MEEAAAEEQMILDGKSIIRSEHCLCAGTHPALRYLYKTLAGRRERLHEVASKRHEEAMSELKRARESDKAQTWSCWTVSRATLGDPGRMLMVRRRNEISYNGKSSRPRGANEDVLQGRRTRLRLSDMVYSGVHEWDVSTDGSQTYTESRK